MQTGSVMMQKMMQAEQHQQSKVAFYLRLPEAGARSDNVWALSVAT